ncbi:RNA-2',3'-PO4:RNA-5'-OH ligase [hydrothermal vent metagenome]|uniref:3'-phosphate/5'-hydroxy nucleic acid ligase n=1 Tax=hydrothermal vent metagenome TaxID=652676 RepID=A0A3B1AZZ8_9ZZZZ
MSRSKAKRQYNSMDMEAQTKGVECRKDKGVVDEIPAAYKDIDQVMENQSDLVEVVHTLKQVVCVKGGWTDDECGLSCKPGHPSFK